MREIILYIVIVLFGLGLIYFAVESRSLKEERDQYKEQINNQYAKRQVELQDTLINTRRENHLLRDSLSNVRSNNNDNILKINSLEGELKKVKGSYTNKPPSELAVEMKHRAGGEPVEEYFLEVDDSLQIYKEREIVQKEIDTKLLT